MRNLSSIMMLLTLLVLAGCGKPPVTKWNMKYTVTVETPKGDITGSAVLHEWYVDRSKNPQFGSGNVHAFEVKGEAVVVDLGKTPKGPHYLFVLAARSEYTAMAVGAHVFDLPKGAYEEIAPKLASMQGAVTLPPALYPLMVTFDDANQPATVKRVKPSRLAATFGRGYALKSITLEITDEPVTKDKVESVLGWVVDAGYLIPPNQQPKFAKDQTTEQRISPSDFIDWRTRKEKREASK